MGLLERIRKARADLGPVDTALYACTRALQACTGGRCRIVSYRVAAQPVAVRERAAEIPVRGIEVRLLGPDEIRGHAFPRPAAVIDHRLAQDALCFAAFRGEEMVGFLWLVTGDYLEDEVRCRFRPEPAGRAAWDFDVYVRPEYRLGRTFMRLWECANAWLHAQGFRWSISRISAFNAASLASHRRLGARFVGRAVFLRLGGLQLAWSSLGPRLHLSARRAPLVRVPAPSD